MIITLYESDYCKTAKRREGSHLGSMLEILIDNYSENSCVSKRSQQVSVSIFGGANS